MGGLVSAIVVASAVAVIMAFKSTRKGEYMSS